MRELVPSAIEPSPTRALGKTPERSVPTWSAGRSRRVGELSAQSIRDQMTLFMFPPDAMVDPRMPPAK